MIDELDSEYVTAARAKGLAERGVARHALRNAVVPLTPVASLGLARLIGGAIITERVFEWRGMGSVLITGLLDQDVNVVMGWLIVSALAVVACNLAADLAGALLDPRTRRG
jgi:peptide/nickel transport system permease protein